MTSLRFVGEMPLWIGLGLSVLVGLLSWRYYRRESFDLPGRMKWFLPLLRSLAFFLGVLILTGPVLQHRMTTGELGRVKIYVDASRSMTMRDPHLPTFRKLAIAEQLGWLEGITVDRTPLEIADQLESSTEATIQRHTVSDDTDPSPELSTSELDSIRVEVLEQFETIQKQLVDAVDSLNSNGAPAVSEQFDTEVLTPLRELTIEPETSEPQPTLLAIIQQSRSIAQVIRGRFEQHLQSTLIAAKPNLQTALARLDETDRFQRLRSGLLDSPGAILEELATRHDVELIMLEGSQHDKLEWDPTQPLADKDLLSIPDFADQTDLSSGIASTQQSARRSSDSGESSSEQRSAIVLLTDGQHNSGESPIQTARVLGNQGAAFYCVGIGADDPAPDLAVTRVEAPQLVFQKDQVRGTMTVRDQMRPGIPFVAQISHGDTVIWQEELQTQNVTERRIEFEFSIDELVETVEAARPTEFKQYALPLELTASIAALPTESEASNNLRSFRLAAITQGHKLLILDSRPRWETRYLRNVFERDDQWDVTTIIAGPSTEHETLPRGPESGQFPEDRDGLFDYDLIIFGEIDRELFQPHELEWIRDFVEIRGGGMVFVDGKRQALREFTGDDIGPLIPVDWPLASAPLKSDSLKLTDSGVKEPSLQLTASADQNTNFWTELPAPHALVPVEALPGSEVLVEAVSQGQIYPAIVTRPFGAGRVLYLSFDETWRWRYKAADLWHQRIWNQLAKFVMPKPFAASDEYVSIDTGPITYEDGEAVDIRVRLLGLDGKPASNLTADALIWKDDRLVATTVLNPDPDVPGIYRGQTTPLGQGNYEVSVRAAGFSDAVLQARSQFEVLPPETGEMDHTAANVSLLKQMAFASGGEYLREEELGRLSELLAPLSSGRVEITEKLLWQSYWWFAAIILLLAVEWILRKRAGLL